MAEENNQRVDAGANLAVGNYDFLKDATMTGAAKGFRGFSQEMEKAKTAEAAETIKAEKEKGAARSAYAAEEKAQIEPIFRQRKEDLERVKLPEKFAPTETNAQDLMTLFTLTGIAGMMLGRGGGNQAAIAAQNAMTGMIKGYMTGRKDLYERERQTFETNVKLMEARKREINDAFETAFKEATTIGLSQAKANLETKLAQAGADVLLAKVRRESLEKSFDAFKELVKVDEKRAEIDNRLESAKVTAKSRVDAAKEAAQIRAQSLADKEKIKALEKTPAFGPAAMLENVFGPGASRGLSRQTAGEINQTVIALNTAQHVQDLAADPDIKFGKLGAFATQVQQQFRANLQAAGLREEDLTKMPANDVISFMQKSLQSVPVDPNDKNAVFQKEAAFAALEIERSVRGGSFLPIGFVKQIGPLLDPKFYTREGFSSILQTRQNELMNKLSSYNFSREDVGKMLDYIRSRAAPVTSETPSWSDEDQARLDELEEKARASK